MEFIRIHRFLSHSFFSFYPKEEDEDAITVIQSVESVKNLELTKKVLFFNFMHLENFS